MSRTFSFQRPEARLILSTRRSSNDEYTVAPTVSELNSLVDVSIVPDVEFTIVAAARPAIIRHIRVAGRFVWMNAGIFYARGCAFAYVFHPQ